MQNTWHAEDDTASKLGATKEEMETEEDEDVELQLLISKLSLLLESPNFKEAKAKTEITKIFDHVSVSGHDNLGKIVSPCRLKNADSHATKISFINKFLCSNACIRHSGMIVTTENIQSISTAANLKMVAASRQCLLRQKPTRTISL